MAKASSDLVADICLYGRTRFATLFRIADAREIHPVGWTTIPGGEERPNAETATEAIWLSVSELRARGVNRGLCRIFDAGGTRYVDVALESHVPSYGSLPWRSVAELPVMTVSADEIVGASS